MMGKQSGQIQMIILDIDSMIPEDHLLRQIKNCVNFDFIYKNAAPYYSHVRRKSIDPVILIKMLLQKATEECLLSATALNLKRLIKEV